LLNKHLGLSKTDWINAWCLESIWRWWGDHRIGVRGGGQVGGVAAGMGYGGHGFRGVIICIGVWWGVIIGHI
jgi:hypothetical protein